MPIQLLPAVEAPARTGYRPDIDGLRAIAVLAVVLFHAFPTVCRGGFAGVDMFFVISGFLITGIVARDLDAGRFRPAAFYGARIRRLAPSLLTVLAAVLAYGFVVLLPTELARLGADTAAGAGFAANLWLWHQADYFDRAAAAKPLLHLWSLGVEEQFYAVWPLLLWAAAHRRRAAIVTLAALSFAASLAWSGDPAANFYNPLTRLWELALGGLLALWRPPARHLAWPGAALIAASLLTLNRAIPYPGWAAAFPVLGSAALLAAGAGPGPIPRWLRYRPLTALGRISYPLYLWHWPLFSYALILRRGRPPTPLKDLALIAASLALAALTYRYIETPLRFGPLRRRNTRRLAAGLALVLLAGLATALAGGFPGRFPALPSLNVAALNDALGDGVFRPTPGMTVTHRDGILTARIGAGPPMLLTGDSVLFHFGPRAQALQDEGRLAHMVYFLTGPSCVPVPGLRRHLGFVDCPLMLPQLDHLLATQKIGAIVIGGFWPGYPGESAIARGGQTFPPGPAATGAFWANLQDFTAGLIHAGHPVYLLRCQPFAPGFDPAHMLERGPFGARVPPSLSAGVPRPALMAQCADSDRRIEAIAAATGARTLDPMAQICPPGPVCPALVDGTRPKFADDKHLRPFYVRRALTFLDPLLTR